MTQVLFSNSISLAQAGFDEYWLQDQIFENPRILNLGELEAIARDRNLSYGCRLDLLLKKPKDETMYEVKVMLGETNEVHIIRTIEYWDKMKKKYPQRQHFAVLIAETFSRRLVNVIQIISHSIPIIAIKANLMEIEGKKVLTFVKVLDAYKEPEEEIEAPGKIFEESYWQKKSAATLKQAIMLTELMKTVVPGIQLNLFQNYLVISENSNNYFFINKRSLDKSIVWFKVNEKFSGDLETLFDANGIPYSEKSDIVSFLLDEKILTEKREFFFRILELQRQLRAESQ